MRRQREPARRARREGEKNSRVTSSSSSIGKRTVKKPREAKAGPENKSRGPKMGRFLCRRQEKRVPAMQAERNLESCRSRRFHSAKVSREEFPSLRSQGRSFQLRPPCLRIEKRQAAAWQWAFPKTDGFKRV
jgi:hypothetical protein